MLIQQINLFAFAGTTIDSQINNELNGPQQPQQMKQEHGEKNQSTSLQPTSRPKINVITVKKVQVTGVHIYLYIASVLLVALCKSEIQSTNIEAMNTLVNSKKLYQELDAKKADLEKELAIKSSILKNKANIIVCIMTFFLASILFIFPLVYGFSNFIDIYISYSHVAFFQMVILLIILIVSGRHTAGENAKAYQKIDNGVLFLFLLLGPLVFCYLFTAQEMLQFFKIEIFWKKFCRYWLVKFIFNCSVKYFILFIANIALLASIIFLNKGDDSVFTEKIKKA